VLPIPKQSYISITYGYYTIIISEFCSKISMNFYSYVDSVRCMFVSRELCDQAFLKIFACLLGKNREAIASDLNERFRPQIEQKVVLKDF
jgi:hypothetical protein